MEEEKRMCDALNELFAEELKEANAHGRLSGKQQGGIEMCKDLGLSKRVDGKYLSTNFY